MTSGDSDDNDLSSSPDFVQSLARGLAVIRAMGRASAPLTIAETAGAAGMTRAGARRILLTLEQLGYVRLKERHFALTPRIMELSSAFQGSDVLWSLVEPQLSALVADINETASAGVLDDLDIVYVLRLKPVRRLHFDLGPGARLPAHVSSMGRVLLADLPAHQLDAYFERARIERYTANTIVDEAVLRRTIAQAGKQGYAIVVGEMDETITGISVPVRNRSGQAVTALNISTTQARVSPDVIRSRILPRLLDAAASIQRSLRLRETTRRGRNRNGARAHLARSNSSSP
jgi:IclR family pca regulon transcriptional regulator